jgi:hypothetical protein
MAGNGHGETVMINGYRWHEVPGAYIGTSYERREVERLGGDPYRVRQEATRITNGTTYTKGNA